MELFDLYLIAFYHHCSMAVTAHFFVHWCSWSVVHDVCKESASGLLQVKGIRALCRQFASNDVSSVDYHTSLPSYCKGFNSVFSTHFLIDENTANSVTVVFSEAEISSTWKWKMMWATTRLFFWFPGIATCNKTHFCDCAFESRSSFYCWKIQIAFLNTAHSIRDLSLGTAFLRTPCMYPGLMRYFLTLLCCLVFTVCYHWLLLFTSLFYYLAHSSLLSIFNFFLYFTLFRYFIVHYWLPLILFLWIIVN